MHLYVKLETNFDYFLIDLQSIEINMYVCVCVLNITLLSTFAHAYTATYRC